MILTLIIGLLAGGLGATEKVIEAQQERVPKCNIQQLVLWKDIEDPRVDANEAPGTH